MHFARRGWSRSTLDVSRLVIDGVHLIPFLRCTLKIKCRDVTCSYYPQNCMGAIHHRKILNPYASLPVSWVDTAYTYNTCWGLLIWDRTPRTLTDLWAGSFEKERNVSTLYNAEYYFVHWAVLQALRSWVNEYTSFSVEHSSDTQISQFFFFFFSSKQAFFQGLDMVIRRSQVHQSISRSFCPSADARKSAASWRTVD